MCIIHSLSNSRAKAEEQQLWPPWQQQQLQAVLRSQPAWGRAPERGFASKISLAASEESRVSPAQLAEGMLWDPAGEPRGELWPWCDSTGQTWSTESLCSAQNSFISPPFPAVYFPLCGKFPALGVGWECPRPGWTLGLEQPGTVQVSLHGRAAVTGALSSFPTQTKLGF